MAQLGWHPYPGDIIPPFEDNILNRTINVLVKSSDGCIRFGYLEIYPKDDYFDEESTWRQFGRDGYTINDVVEWAYAVPSLIPIQQGA